MRDSQLPLGAPPRDFPRRKPGVGDPPERVHWRTFSRLLAQSVDPDDLRQSDRETLRILVLARCRFDKFARIADDADGVAATADGSVKAHPAVSIAKDAESTVMRCLAELRMTPRSRAVAPNGKHAKPPPRPEAPDTESMSEFERRNAHILNGDQHEADPQGGLRPGQLPATPGSPRIQERKNA